MQRTLLIVVLILATVFAFGQKKMNYKSNLSAVSFVDQNIPEQLLQNSDQIETPRRKLPAQSDNSKDIIIREIGESANGFSVLGARQYLWVNQEINSVCFTHRMASTPGSGYVGYDYSIDGGESFTNNIQVYDPSQNEGYNARYPQGGIYNPAGNTDPANAVYGYFAPTLDGSSGSGSWGGYAFGTHMFTGSQAPTINSTTSGDEYVQDVPDTYSISSQGLAIAADVMEPDFIYSDEMIITKGHFNLETGDFDMERDLVEFPAGGEDINGELARVPDVKVAFSPDGSIGYIAYLSNNGENDDESIGCYYPILYKTVDDGATWDGPYNVELGGDDGIPAILDFLSDDIIAAMFEAPVPDRDEIPFTTAFELDLSVDNSGNPHLIFNVGVGNQEWSFFSSYSGSIGCQGCVAMVHLHSTDFGDTWLGDTLCTVKTFRGLFPYEGGNPISVDNRPYVASTFDGTKMFFSWIDTDIFGIEENTSPDIFCIGYDVENNTYSEKKNVTFFSPATWEAYMASGSNYVFDNEDGSYTIPFVYQEISPVNLLEPAQFMYIDNFILTDEDLSFTTGIADPVEKTYNLSTCFPNPCNNTTKLNLHLENPASVNYCITTLLGQTVWNGQQRNLAMGDHTLIMDVSDLKTGVYLYSVIINDEVQTGKMLVK